MYLLIMDFMVQNSPRLVCKMTQEIQTNKQNIENKKNNG